MASKCGFCHDARVGCVIVFFCSVLVASEQNVLECVRIRCAWRYGAVGCVRFCGVLGACEHGRAFCAFYRCA